VKPLLVILVATGCWTSKAPAHTESPPPPPPKTVDLVQPVKMEKVEPREEDEVDGEEGGEEGGVIGGVVGGQVGGVIGGPPPPPPPAPPQNVSPTMLEGSRIAGDKNIVPDDDTKTAITRAEAKGGPSRIVASLKLCLDDTGAVSSVSLLKSSGYPAYDAKLIATIRTTWRYRPFIVNGRATAVCTAVTFIYAQH